MKALSMKVSCVILLLGTSARAEDAPPAVADSGFQALVGATIAGRDGDGQAALTFFSQNGDVKRVDGDDEATGAWTLRGETVCFTFDDADDESCYRVRVSGDMAVFTAQDGASKAYQVLPGDATAATGR